MLLGSLAVDLDAVAATVEDHDAVFGVYLDGDRLAEFLFLLRHVGDAGSLFPEGGVAGELCGLRVGSCLRRNGNWDGDHPHLNLPPSRGKRQGIGPGLRLFEGLRICGGHGRKLGGLSVTRQRDSSLRFAAFKMTNGDVGEGRRGTEDHEGRHNVGEADGFVVGGGSGRFANRPYRR